VTQELLKGRRFGSRGLEPGSRDYHEADWNDDELYRAIQSHLADEGVYKAVQALEAGDLCGRSDADIAISLTSSCFESVQLCSRSPERSEAVHGLGQRVDREEIYSKLIVLTWAVSGPSEWLVHWPWKAQNQPEEFRDIDRRHARFDNEFRALPREPFTTEPGLVHSFIEVFEDEVLGETFPAEGHRRIEERCESLQTYLTAHAAAVDACAARLRVHVTAAVANRRRDLRFTSAVNEGLELKIVPLPIPEITLVENAVGLPAFCLNDTSFVSIVSVIDFWSRKIEQGAKYLRPLSENGLSAVLCSVLEVAIGMAMHDVFVYNGSADVVVPARRLAELNGVELPHDQPDLFIAEAKKGSGPELASKAKDQLDNYLGRRISAGCLLFYVTALDFDLAFDGIIKGLELHDGFVDREGDIGKAPVLRFKDPFTASIQRIAVVGVSLSKIGTQPEEHAKRQSARKKAKPSEGRALGNS
jgi:hypothetical protein